MPLRVFRFFGEHVCVARPVRPDLFLPARFPFRSVDNEHPAERRLNFRVFAVVGPKQIAIADAFSRGIDGKGLVAGSARTLRVIDVIKMVASAAFVRSGFVVRDLNALYLEILRQPGRKKTNDLEVLEIIESAGTSSGFKWRTGSSIR